MAVDMEDPKTVQAYDITLSGQRMHFWKGGTGPGLLLLHAAWGDAEMSWRSVWGRLSRSCTVIAPDLPGFGQTSPIRNPSLPVMAKQLKELFDALHMDRVVVVGNSFGAAVAIQFANDCPEAVSHLVLVNGGYMPVIPGPVRKFLALPIVNQGFRKLIRRLTFSLQTLKRSFVDIAKLPAGFFDTILGNALAYSKISFDTAMNITAPLAKPSVPMFLCVGCSGRFGAIEAGAGSAEVVAGFNPYHDQWLWSYAAGGKAGRVCSGDTGNNKTGEVTSSCYFSRASGALCPSAELLRSDNSPRHFFRYSSFLELVLFKKTSVAAMYGILYTTGISEERCKRGKSCTSDFGHGKKYHYSRFLFFLFRSISVHAEPLLKFGIHKPMRPHDLLVQVRTVLDR